MNPPEAEDINCSNRLSDKIIDLLQRENYSEDEFLMKPRMLLQSIGLSDYEIRLAKIHISRKHVHFQTASQFEHQMTPNQLQFGCRSLDRIIRNGLSRGITEISGEAGVGKSQLSLQLSLMVQLPIEFGGLEKAAVFICTEDAFPSERLFQLAHCFTKRYGDKNYLDNIYIEHVHDSEHLLKCVLSRLPNLMCQKQIGLIVVDSVAGVYRSETDAITRANDMRKVAHGLQMISTKYECAIVCVNQVTAPLSSNDNNMLAIPCLGLAWSNLVTTRIQIDKTSANHTIPTINRAGKFSETSIPIRKCSVIFSPYLPRASCAFMITADGIVDVPV